MDRQPNRTVVRRALVSVSDKSGLVELGKGLAAFGVEILSTGGTRQALASAGVATVEVAEYTGFPEMFDGRVKTLHPKIHGGLLHRRDVPDHLASAGAHGIKAIDLVVVNLYPFEAVAGRADATPDEIVENIDIGGPAMIRSAAKNHAHVAVVTDPSQYPALLHEMRLNGGALSGDFLRRLAVAAFARTAEYDAAIHRTLARLGDDGEFPGVLQPSYRRLEKLRYGENPHQRAALYVDPAFRGASIVGARKLHGKELSYNNLLDLDAALAIVGEFDRPTAVIVKHNNPCGAASADELATAFRCAWDGDPVSAFGSIVGCNRAVDEATASAMVESGRFIEAVVAPDFAPEAVRLLTTVPTWKASVRLLAAGAHGLKPNATRIEARPITGGLLMQTHDAADGFAEAKVVTRKAPTPAQRRDLEFAWKMAKHVRSNAIVLAAGEATVGVGAGQMSRVDAGRIAVEKAGPKAVGSVLASDAFFPFRDNVDQAAKAGIVAIVQPGGSKRDRESIDACDEHGIAMLFTGVRSFKH